MSRRTHLQGEWSGRSVEESEFFYYKVKSKRRPPAGDTPLIPGLSVHRYWAVYISPMFQSIKTVTPGVIVFLGTLPQ